MTPRTLSLRAKGIMLLVVQLALVLSIAAKYAWERDNCPMVWTRTTQFDPEQPLRGRYLALTLAVDACALPEKDAEKQFSFSANGEPRTVLSQSWTALVQAKDGRLVAERSDPASLREVQHVTQRAGRPCQYAALGTQTEYFIADHARSPFPLTRGEELWALVTVPPAGPPRPVQLAVSDGRSFRTLDLH